MKTKVEVDTGVNVYDESSSEPIMKLSADQAKALIFQLQCAVVMMQSRADLEMANTSGAPKRRGHTALRPYTDHADDIGAG